MKPAHYLNLSGLVRPNVHVKQRPVVDVAEIVKGATALFLWGLILIMVMA